MAKLLNWHIFKDKVKEKRLSIFTPHDLVRLFGVSSVAANFFIYRNTKKGLLIRLKKSQKGSLYCLAEEFPDQYLLANRIYEPSYISFDTALSFYNIIPETIYALMSATTKPTREFLIYNINFVYRRIKKAVYTGYKPIVYMNNTILMATPEKALADYLYFVALKRSSLSYERWNLEKINKKRLQELIKLFNNPVMFSLVENLYANNYRVKRIY